MAARADFQAGLAALRPQFDDIEVGESGRAPMAQLWSALGRWIIAEAAAGPAPGVENLLAWTRALDSKLSADALQLDERTWVLAPRLGEVGNLLVFQQAPAPGGLQLSLRLDELAKTSASADLRCWTLHDANGPCALSASLRLLPRDAHGRPRFAVPATRAQAAGATVLGELEIWRWEGTTARLLLSGNHLALLDGARESFRGDTLHVPMKMAWKSLGSCGGCKEPEGEWTVRVAADGVRDLGQRALKPELALVDELCFHLLHGQAASELADAAVIERVTATMASLSRGEGAGMVMDLAVTQLPQERFRVCLQTDSLPRLVFEGALQHGARRLLGVAEQRESPCVPEASR